MPVAPSSLVDPGEIESKAPLKKRTVGYMLTGVLLLAIAGVFAPKLLKGDSTTTAPRRGRPVGVGNARQIDTEFEDATRRTKIEAARTQRSEPPAAIAAGAGAPGWPAASRALPPLPSADAALDPVFASDLEGARGARGGQTGLALYDGQTPAAPLPADASAEREAAARTSTSLKVDYGDASGAQPAWATQAAKDLHARLKELVTPDPVAAASASSSDAGSFSEHLAGAIELQRRGGAPWTARSDDRAWLREFAQAPRPAPLKPYRVTNPFTLMQGKVMPAVLGADLNTDLPGSVTAYLTEDVYDSLSSRYLLIPKGSALIGRYSNAIKSAQDRILFAFERIILPDGTSVDLPGFGGADPGGAAGIEGGVDNHFLQQFGASFLIALLADRADRGHTVLVGGAGPAEAVTSAGRVLADVSGSILSRSKSIDPTITVPKGTAILVNVAKDIEFSHPYESTLQ